jgi:hypothetical protein
MARDHRLEVSLDRCDFVENVGFGRHRLKLATYFACISIVFTTTPVFLGRIVTLSMSCST